MVFKHSSGPPDSDAPDKKLGISVIDSSCACSPVTGHCLCLHIRHFYGEVFPEPCAYWAFDTDILRPPTPNPGGVPEPELRQRTSPTGDECHYTIHYLSNSRARRLWERLAKDSQLQLGLCVEGESREFSEGLAVQLKVMLPPPG